MGPKNMVRTVIPFSTVLMLTGTALARPPSAAELARRMDRIEFHADLLALELEILEPAAQDIADRTVWLAGTMAHDPKDPATVSLLPLVISTLDQANAILQAALDMEPALAGLADLLLAVEDDIPQSQPKLLARCEQLQNALQEIERGCAEVHTAMIRSIIILEDLLEQLQGDDPR